MSSADAHGADGAQVRDPFAPVEASPVGAGVLVVLAAVSGLVAMLGGLSPITGPVGMVLGLIAP